MSAVNYVALHFQFFDFSNLVVTTRRFQCSMGIEHGRSNHLQFSMPIEHSLIEHSLRNASHNECSMGMHRKVVRKKLEERLSKFQNEV